ncbi:hypothetical protein ACFYZ9_02980 [Streptomyces sp. NPDC001691]|uniref:hypothetical protein n=1 Tax=unclassified Streptomyces TaxID=2593676 RepID=UPI001676554F|nr:hypothetical protein [Streptomyces sp. SDr-06]
MPRPPRTVLAALLALTAVTALATGDAAAAPGRPDPHRAGVGQDALPPWPAPADASAAVAAAGLEMLSAEGMVQHTHTHLDVLVDGRPVTVPASIGIDEPRRRISPLHTHDTSGVIHVESPRRAEFTLGQFMAEWQVPLGQDRIGGLHAGRGRHLTAYVNGRKAAGNPAAIVLHAHDEIALVFARDTDRGPVPKDYAWPHGL